MLYEFGYKNQDVSAPARAEFHFTASKKREPELIRIYALAKELKTDNKELVDICQKVGLSEKRSALAGLTDEEVALVKDYIRNASSRSAQEPSGPSDSAPMQRPNIPSLQTGKVPVLKPVRTLKRLGDSGQTKPAATIRTLTPKPAEEPVPVPPQTAAEPGSAEPESAEPKKPARVSLAIAPWGEVVINGEVKGVSPPLDDLELPPGHHEVEIRNGQSEPHRMTLELGPGESYKIKHKFK